MFTTQAQQEFKQSLKAFTAAKEAVPALGSKISFISVPIHVRANAKNSAVGSLDVLLRKLWVLATELRRVEAINIHSGE